MSFHPQDAPAPSILECSVIGPGVGESVIVHLGGGSWMIVDSCLSETGRPVALSYLESIGVAPSAISLVVATHWHDDHIRGLAAVVSAAPNARFACSGALRCDEFQSLIASASSRRRTTRHGSGVDEMSEILNNLLATQRQVEWLHENQTIARDTVTDLEVTSLSPSSATVSRSLIGLAQLAPKLRANLRVVPSVEPNETSVVLHVRLGSAVALLGADLETVTDKARGWIAIILSKLRPPSRAQFLKVAHHGSSNADHEDIWNVLLHTAPVAALTPFTRSGLPRAADVSRIKSRSARLHQASPLPVRPIKRQSAVDRTVGQFAKRIPVPQSGRLGQIRVRLETTTGQVVSQELFGAAFTL